MHSRITNGTSRARATNPVSSLPAPVTNFIGRDCEITDIRAQLRGSRLITLTGMGGVGKTRLALQVASRVTSDFDHGVWFVNLENLSDPSLLWETVSTALGVSHHPSQTLQSQLSSYLLPRQLLLVLDNCEHLASACAELVSQLLASAPELTILATSREALDITGEQVFAVAPLSVPTDEVMCGDPAANVRALREVESVQLFLDRARAHNSHFALDESNASAVARLCVRLEGLPLAIELAANRLRSLGVDQILERLEDRFSVLSGTMKNTAPRQRTLRALVDWSYERCTPVQQRLWERLSVFTGPFDLEAAEYVCTDSEVEVRDVFDTLDQLIAQSIVITNPSGSRVRYRMLETIREYGSQRLRETDCAATCRRRHRDFYLSLTESALRTWCGPHQSQTLARLQGEHQNLRTALAWSLSTPGQAVNAVALGSALRYHWVANGRLSEGRRWLGRALECSTGPSVERAQALWVLAWAAILQGDMDVAQKSLTECLTITSDLDDRVDEAYALTMHGTSELFAGRMTSAITAFDAATTMHENQNNPAGVLLTLFQKAVALTHTEQSARARATCERALAFADRFDESWSRSYTLWALAIEEWQHGSLPAAERHGLDALRIAETFHDRVCTALTLDTLACIAATRNNHQRSAVLLGVADSVWEPLGTTIGAFGLHLAGHHIRCEQLLRTSLDQNIYTELVKSGREYDRTDAITWALSGLAPKQQQATLPDPLAALTKREKEVAVLLSQGMSNREMAAALVLSPRTIEGHMENILAKLGCASRGQVIALLTSLTTKDGTS